MITIEFMYTKSRLHQIQFLESFQKYISSNRRIQSNTDDDLSSNKEVSNAASCNDFLKTTFCQIKKIFASLQWGRHFVKYKNVSPCNVEVSVEGHPVCRTMSVFVPLFEDVHAITISQIFDSGQIPLIYILLFLN